MNYSSNTISLKHKGTKRQNLSKLLGKGRGGVTAANVLTLQCQVQTVRYKHMIHHSRATTSTSAGDFTLWELCSRFL